MSGDQPGMLPHPLGELRRRRRPVRDVNSEHAKQLSRLDRIALAITDRVGTMGFFLIIFSWTVLWLGWNLLAPKPLQFDPPIAFVLWLFISNMIQIFLMPLLMVGLGRISRVVTRSYGHRATTRSMCGPSTRSTRSSSTWSIRTLSF